MQLTQLTQLSDDELLSSLATVCFDSRRLLGRLLVHLAEVENRRLELRQAYSSMFDFCRRRLGFSEGEAVRRIEAARLVKRFPSLLGAIERGDIHLTGLLLLRDHFTPSNVDSLIAEAKGKSKREIQEIIARLAPKPDVLPTLTPLPTATPLSTPAPAPAPPSTAPARVEPLSPQRYRLELTISGAVREKLDHARDLMRHQNPKGDLETILDQALDALISKVEKRRMAKTDRPLAPR